MVGHRPALGLGDAADLQRIGDVVAHRAVRQQRHMLENHADMVSAQRAQVGLVQARHVAPEQLDRTGGRLDQAIDVTYQCGLAGPGQAHDAKDFATWYFESGILHTDHAAEACEHLGLADAFLAYRLDGGVGLVTKDLPDTRCLDNRFRHVDFLP
jgi:hypothetical protein